MYLNSTVLNNSCVLKINKAKNMVRFIPVLKLKKKKKFSNGEIKEKMGLIHLYLNPFLFLKLKTKNMCHLMRSKRNRVRFTCIIINSSSLNWRRKNGKPMSSRRNRVKLTCILITIFPIIKEREKTCQTMSSNRNRARLTCFFINFCS